MDNINIESTNILKKSTYIKKRPILTPEEKALKKKEQNRKYALNYYRKRVDNDPNYSKILNDRVKKNTNIRKGNDPDKPKPVGRPRIQ